MHSAWLAVADDPQVGGWIRRLQSERPVGTVVVVVGDVDPEHLLKVPAAHDEQPVKALGPHRPDPALGVGVGVGRLHRRHKRLGSLRREDVVEGAADLGVDLDEHISFVIAAMQRIAPDDRAGFNRLDASIAPPEVAPAPITVWISSMNRMAWGNFSSSLTTDFSRSSNNSSTGAARPTAHPTAASSNVRAK